MHVIVTRQYVFRYEQVSVCCYSGLRIIVWMPCDYDAPATNLAMSSVTELIIRIILDFYNHKKGIMSTNCKPAFIF